jgi:hypothetical protein
MTAMRMVSAAAEPAAAWPGVPAAVAARLGWTGRTPGRSLPGTPSPADTRSGPSRHPPGQRHRAGCLPESRVCRQMDAASSPQRGGLRHRHLLRCARRFGRPKLSGPASRGPCPMRIPAQDQRCRLPDRRPGPVDRTPCDAGLEVGTGLDCGHVPVQDRRQSAAGLHRRTLGRAGWPRGAAALAGQPAGEAVLSIRQDRSAGRELWSPLMGDATGRSSCQDDCEEAGLPEPQNGPARLHSPAGIRPQREGRSRES